MFSTCPSVCPLKTCEHDISNQAISMQIGTNDWSMGQGQEMVNFGGQEVKYQGHRRPIFI